MNIKISMGIVFTFFVLKGQAFGQNIAAAPCEDGYASVLLTLNPLAEMPAPEAVDLPRYDPMKPLQLVSPDQDFKVRIDTCVSNLDPSDIKVKQVWEKMGPTMPLDRVAWNGPQSTVVGLADAILEQKSENLAIRFGDRALLKGWKTGPQSFVTYSSMFKSFSTGEMLLNLKTVITGQLVMGDPFVGQTCQLGETIEEEYLNLGPSHWNATRCSRLNDGHTRIYRYIQLRFEDQDQGITADLSLEGLEKSFVYRLNHHNSCDSLMLTLPQAQIALTYPEVTGCDGVLEGAPLPASQGSKSIRYRILYRDGTEVSGDAEKQF